MENITFFVEHYGVIAVFLYGRYGYRKVAALLR